MKIFFIAALLAALQFTVASAQSLNPVYNAKLADSLGADDYGMRSYVMAILKTGPNQAATPLQTDSLFKGHMTNMGLLEKAGKLVVAGPFGKNSDGYRGIFILNTATLDEAKKMVDTDPAIKAGLLKADLIPWYGSAALPLYLPLHKQVEKKSVL
ncbi:MAG: YciI family protein [Chitinophagaceae bacterium]|jgi:uncharacterized protein YciI|nr:YciI family protein [Chitinophagaceae bacterium]